MRLFFAFDLPPRQTRSLAELIPPDTAGVRRVRAERMHVTLRFVGSVSPEVRDGLIDGLVRNETAFRNLHPEVRIVGTGVFPGLRRARVLWAGLRFDRDLMEIHEQVSNICRAQGLPDESGHWHPHVTLARFAGAAPEWLPAFLERTMDVRLEPFRVDKVTLYDSRTESSGPIYTPLAVAGR